MESRRHIVLSDLAVVVWALGAASLFSRGSHLGWMFVLLGFVQAAFAWGLRR